MASPHESSSNALTSFRQHIAEYTRVAICGRSYVLTDRLKRDHLQELDIERLLAKIYRGNAGYPISASTIYRHSQVVFIILLASGLSDDLGRVIKYFQDQNINDGKLPIDREDLHRCVRRENVPENLAQEIVAKFYGTQWKFCAYVFGDHESIKLSAEYIIPVCNMKDINNKSGMVKLSEIVVLEDFVGEGLRKAVPGSAYIPIRDEDGKKDGRRYQFALKTFASSQRRIWQRERTAFNGLRGRQGIVQCFDCYTYHAPSWPIAPQRHSKEVEPTFNILLELGEFDLADHFYRTDPPFLQEEIEEFWNSIFPIAVALDGLHNFTNRHVNEVYKGWHGNIKPTNILSINGCFSLADPGFAKFEQVWDPTQAPKTQLSGGTWSYGAPERLLDRGLASVTQAVDIWSLGCVFSEAVTWLVGGQSMIKAYIDVRRGGTRAAKLPYGDVGDVRSSDIFHDGRSVLQGVVDWHRMLRSSIRRNDHITDKVLDLVETKMLVADPSERITAQQLAQELYLVKESAQNQTRFPIPSNIVATLLAVDEGDSHLARSPTTSSIASSLGPGKLPSADSHYENVHEDYSNTTQNAENLKSAPDSSQPMEGEPAEMKNAVVRSLNNTPVHNEPALGSERKPSFPDAPTQSSARQARSQSPRYRESMGVA